MAEIDDFEFDLETITKHKTLRDRATAAYNEHNQRISDEKEAEAQILVDEARRLMQEILKLHPQDALSVQIERGINTSGGDPIVVFTYDKLKFRVRHGRKQIMTKTSSEFGSEVIYDDMVILEFKQPPAIWVQITSLAVLGQKLAE